MTPLQSSRPALKLVHGAAVAPAEVEWSWFCGHCAAPSPSSSPPPPTARVCASCGLGLLLETRADTAPGPRDAFLVIDTSLLVQALSRRAQALLELTEAEAVNRPVAELLVAADAEASSSSSLARAIVERRRRRRGRGQRGRAALEYVRRPDAREDRALRAPARRWSCSRIRRPAPARRRLTLTLPAQQAGRAVLRRVPRAAAPTVVLLAVRAAR